MTLRELRRRWTPEWLRSDARRRARNVLYRRLGVERCHTPPVVARRPELLVRSSLRYVVAHELLANPDFAFLQIGAFDGVGDDDLRELILSRRLRGVLVEPQPAAFAALAEAYRDAPQLTLINGAIAERKGVRNLYCRRGAISMAASFDRDHLRRHGVPDDEIVARPVPCHTVAGALAAAGLDRVDLIQIDAEGYDYEIIRSIDFQQLRPAIVRFEYRHMRSTDADACLNLLAGHGYRFLIEPRDILAHRIADGPLEAAPSVGVAPAAA